MFELQEQSPFSYLKQLSPNRYGKVTEATIDRHHSHPLNLDRNSIKILSWNVAKNNYNPNWSQDFLALVQKYQPDKIFLQEVRLCAVNQNIPELSAMGWSFAPNLIDRWNNTYSGVLTATNYGGLSSKAKITQHQEPISDTPKVSLFVEHPWGDRTLLTINAHLINFVETSKFQAQLDQIEAIVSQHQGAVIFSGDFNTWNRSRWSLLLAMTAKLDLTPVSFPWTEAQKIKRFLLSPPLDYIFYRGFQQNTANAKVIDTFDSSDHNPLLVELYK